MPALLQCFRPPSARPPAVPGRRRLIARASAGTSTEPRRDLTLVVGDDFPVQFACQALGAKGLEAKARQLHTETRGQLEAVDIVAAALVADRGPELWLKGGRAVQDAATSWAKRGRVLVQPAAGGWGMVAWQSAEDLVLLPRSCAKDDGVAFVGFAADLALVQQLHELEATSGKEALNALYKAASLLQQNIQHTTNFFNRLAPAYDSMFHSVLLPSTRAAVLKAVDTLRGQAESNTGGSMKRSRAGARAAGGAFGTASSEASCSQEP